MSRERTERFWRLVDKNVRAGECWHWLGALDADGYGRVSVAGRGLRAHRVAWSIVNGAVPPGHVLDHVCRNRSCVRPTHLEVVAQAENARRGAAGRAARREARIQLRRAAAWLHVEGRHYGSRERQQELRKRFPGLSPPMVDILSHARPTEVQSPESGAQP